MAAESSRLSRVPECGEADPHGSSRGDSERGEDAANPSKRPRPGGLAHPFFVEMAGKTLAGAKVLRRAENLAGNARWLSLLACGHESIEYGITLRDFEKRGLVRRCVECRPKQGRPRRATGKPPCACGEPAAPGQSRCRRCINAATKERRAVLTPGNRGVGGCCALCGGLSHRVVGEHCRKCGLAYAPEPPIHVDVDARRAL